MSEPQIKLDESKYLDILYLERFIETVSALLAEGYGEASMKVTVRNGAVKMVALSKTNTIDLANKP